MIQPNFSSLASIKMLEYAAIKLGDLVEDFVFIGGSATALFITDNSVPEIRPTLDVDCLIDVASLSEYYKIELALKKRGFKQSIDDEVICRWRHDDLILDVMPTDQKILGFTNKWYVAAVKYRVK